MNRTAFKTATFDICCHSTNLVAAPCTAVRHQVTAMLQVQNVFRVPACVAIKAGLKDTLLLKSIALCIPYQL